MNIDAALHKHGGNASAAARELGIPRTTFRRLAAADAYSAKGGWVSGRDAKVITYHKKYGEVHRMTINPDMARALQ